MTATDDRRDAGPPGAPEDPGFLGTGWAFPPRVDDRSGAIALASGEDDVTESIRIVLGTAKGERVMRPDFGCGIHDLAFEYVSAQVVAQIEATVRDGLRAYEARIEVLRVAVGTAKLADGRLDIAVDYRIRATNQPGNLVYPFYFAESASR